MISIKNTGRVMGALLLMLFVTGVLGIELRGLSSSLTESQTFLKDIFDNSGGMKISIFADLVSGVISICIATILFPLLSRYDKRVAIGFLSFWIIENGLIAVSNVTHLSLISLSEKYVNLGSPDSEYFNTLGFLKLEDYFATHFLILIAFNLGAILLYYLFLKTKLVPKFLSIWGLLAATLAIIGASIQLLGQSGSMLFFIPNGLFVLTLTIWLLIKGFNESNFFQNNQIDSKKLS